MKKNMATSPNRLYNQGLLYYNGFYKTLHSGSTFMADSLNIKTCLVTGGAGFIGSHLVEGLLRSGYTVRVLDNLSTGKLQNLAACAQDIDFVEGDIRDLAAVRSACEGVDAVFHHAALASVNQSFQNPLLTHDINVTGTVNVLESALGAQVQKVVFVSSAAVYQADSALAKSESAPLNLLSPYAYSKWLGEQYCKMYSELFGLSVVCFRYFNVYGSRQNACSQYSGVISIFMEALLKQTIPVIYGDGLQTRDFVHVSDVVQANLLALKDKTTGVFNVGSGHQHSILEILEQLRAYMDVPQAFEYQAARQGDPRHSLADIQKIKDELGFLPSTAFSEGLKEVLDWARECVEPGRNS